MIPRYLGHIVPGLSFRGSVLCWRGAEGSWGMCWLNTACLGS